MRIEIGNYLLVEHNDERSIINRWKVNGQRAPEVRAFTLAEFVRIFDRGGRSTIIELEVTRLHEDVPTAELYNFDHDTEVPTSGNVEFTVVSRFGQEEKRYLEAASIQASSSDVIVGVTTFHVYRIVGGAVLTTEPS